MDWNTLQGNWNEAKGKVKSQWSRLTDDDLLRVEGNKERLVGVIQHKYGIARDEAEQQLSQFMATADSWLDKARNGVQEAIDKGRDYVNQGLERGKELVHHGRDYVHDTSSSQMAADVKDLIARNPVYSAIIGVGIGFLVGRMLTSSSKTAS